MNRTIPHLGAALLLMLLPWLQSPVAAEQGDSEVPTWNQWRGPDRNGHATALGSPDWSTAPSMEWSVEVGSGQASPVIAGDRVLVFDRIGDREHLAAYRLSNGERIWQDSEPVAFKPGMGGGCYGSGPKATPVVSDGVVLTYGVTSVLTARSLADGERLWRRDLKQEAEKPVLYWGNSMSPVVVDGRVVIQFGNDRRGGIRAYDLQTGKESWRIEGGGSSYASPIVVRDEGETAIAMMTWEGLLGLSSEGEELWRAPLAMSHTRQNTATPLFHRGSIVYVGEKRPLHASRLEHGENGWRLTPVWQREDLPHDLASPIAFDDRVCGFTTRNRGQLVCVDLETGKDLWRGPARSGDFVVLMVTEEHLLALYPEGRLVVHERTASAYDPIAEYEIADAEVWSHPAVLPGALVVKTDGSLTRWQLAGAD